MKYLIRTWHEGRFQNEDIDEEEFNRLKQAKDILRHAFEVEEKYETVILNYLDFEKELVSLATDSMVRNDYGYQSFFQIRLQMNRRLINLLTSVRLYIDQIKHNVPRAAIGAIDAKKQVKQFFSDCYDNAKEYRFMEELRNHVQHRGLPVHNSGRGSQWDDSREQNSYSVSISSLKKNFNELGSFKSSVLNEMGDEVDLKIATRIYIQLISGANHRVREMILENVTESRNLIQETIDKYSKEEGSTIVLLVKIDDTNQEHSFDLMTAWDDIRQKLVLKNPELINLSARLVTSA